MSDAGHAYLELWDVQIICLISTAAAAFLIIELTGTIELIVGIYAPPNLNR